MIRMPFAIVIKWRALALKRLAYLSELQRTGRWHRQYKSQAAFEQALRDADADAERWKRVAHESATPAEAAEELETIARRRDAGLRARYYFPDHRNRALG